MRSAVLVLIAGLALSLAVAAQEPPQKKKKKQPAVKQTVQNEPKGRQKPTPEQIRKFNELQKK